MNKVGIFFCGCGGNISDVVDMERLKKSFDLHVSEYLCSVDGQALIGEKVAEEEYTRIVIAACSPKIYERTFMDLLRRIGLNPYLLEIANLREQCSWVHTENPEHATAKAEDLIRMAVARVRMAEPLEPKETEVERSVLVVGAGISGVMSALSIANSGYKVILVERKSEIGGYLNYIGKIFSHEKLAEECAMCILGPLVEEISRNPNVEVLSNAEVKNVGGRVGNFAVTIEKNPTFVNERCISCGKCEKECHVNIPNDFELGLAFHKAIYRPTNAVPKRYVIDPQHCTHFIDGCSACEKVCPTDAIDFKETPREIKVKTGAIIVATGFQEFDPAMMPQYKKSHRNIITQTELARILDANGPTKGKLQCPSGGEVPNLIAMIQCVGSRDDKFLRYCSKICCGVALKHASMIKDSYPKTEVVICYTDIRMPGLYENYLQWVQSKGVTLIKGKPLEVLSDDYRLILRLEDSLAGELIELHPDLIVLSVGVLPSDGTRKVADTLHLSLTEDGWIKQEHAKLKPVKTNVDGIFVAGMVVGPNDVGECVASARAAAEEAMELISTGKIEISPEIAVINESCDGCAYCIEPCPYNAITLIEYMRDGRIKKTVEVDEAVCTGCGICQATCPQKGVYIKGYKIEQISAMVDIALGGEICQKISK